MHNPQFNPFDEKFVLAFIHLKQPFSIVLKLSHLHMVALTSFGRKVGSVEFESVEIIEGWPLMLI